MSENSFIERREGIRKILLKACYDNIFSECNVAWYSPSLHNVETVAISRSDDRYKNGESVPDLPFFDLASLTKPLVTLLCILTLVDRKIIKLDDTLDILLEQNVAHEFRLIRLKNLLCHNSGLPAHIEFWRDLDNRNEEYLKKSIIDTILSQRIDSREKASTHIYSDLGYLLLGFVIERKSGKKLDDFWENEIAKPLGIENIINFPKKINIEQEKYAITGKCPWTGDLLRGVVHDDNCRMLGGVCGHAGLFGTALGVLTLCQEMYFHLKKKKTCLPFSHEIFSSCCKRVSRSEWTQGFNLPSKTGSSSGSLLSEMSLGHLGFTGTSFWIDPVNDLIIVLLTNRVLMGEDRKGIQDLRPAVHDFLAQRLIKKRGILFKA